MVSSPAQILSVGTLYSYRSAALLGLGKHIEVVPLKHVELILKVRTFGRAFLNAETSRERGRGDDLLRPYPNADQDLNPSVLP